MYHPQDPTPVTTSPTSGGLAGFEPPVLHLRGGNWHIQQAAMPSPEVTLPGSFVTALLPDLPVGQP